MANFTALSGSYSSILNMQNIPYFSGYSSFTPDKISVAVSLEPQRYDYYGKFTAQSNGDIVGTIDSIYYTPNYSGRGFSVTGLNVDAKIAFDLIGRREVDQLLSTFLNGNDTITGTDSSYYSAGQGDRLLGYGGNDLFAPMRGDDFIDGGTGIDTVKIPWALKSTGFAMTLDGAKISVFDPTYTYINVALSTYTLKDVERVFLDDVAVALDIAGNAGKAYRIYQAAFNRTPDQGGVGYWMSALDKGESLRNIAQAFMDSAEFHSKYGANLDNSALINRLYENVLHRAADPGGLKYWGDILADTHNSRAEVLVAFSESAENVNALTPLIGNGFTYIPYG